MQRNAFKITFLLSFPFFCFFAAVGVLAFYEEKSVPLPFSQSDFVGFHMETHYLLSRASARPSERPLKIAAQYEVSGNERKLFVRVIGPADGTFKILVPLEVTILAKSVKQEETFEDLHAFVTPLSLGSEEEKIFSFRYEMPRQKTPYSLRLEPFGNKVAYHVEVDSKVLFEGTLEKTKILREDFKREKSPLTLASVSMKNFDVVELYFNKVPEAPGIDDVINFSITDENEKNAEVTDRIFIRQAELRGQKFTLSVSGITVQPGERYELHTKNIDLTPATITLIQPKF